MKIFVRVMCTVLTLGFLSCSNVWAGERGSMITGTNWSLATVVFLAFVLTLFIVLRLVKEEPVSDDIDDDIIDVGKIKPLIISNIPITFNVKEHGVKYSFFPLVEGSNIVCPFIKDGEMFSTMYRDSLHSGKKRELYVRKSMITSLKKDPDFFNRINENQGRFGKIEIVGFFPQNIWGLTDRKKGAGGRNEKTVYCDDSC